jgi:hypothetical protein
MHLESRPQSIILEILQANQVMKGCLKFENVIQELEDSPCDAVLEI